VEALDIYFGKRDIFYCVVVEDVSIARDNKLSELFDEPVNISYYSFPRTTQHIYCAKFWKDKNSAVGRFGISNKPRSNGRIVELTREQFIDAIPDSSEIDSQDSNYLKNLQKKAEEIKYQKTWKEYRKKYKAIGAYVKVSDPQWWLPCKECGLIPLVWEFNNGRSTACGCGKNEYDHHSIHAESIMSFVTRNNGSALGYNTSELRMNWNQWVKTGQDFFKEQKKLNDKLW
jgi:hypothetical protein